MNFQFAAFLLAKFNRSSQSCEVNRSSCSSSFSLDLSLIASSILRFFSILSQSALLSLSVLLTSEISEDGMSSRK